MSDDTTSAINMKIQREAQAWIVRLESGAVTEEDARAFKVWCAQSRDHALSFTEARKIWVSMGEAARREKFRMDADKSASSLPRPVVNLGRRSFIGGAVAASVTYLAVRPPLELWPSVGEVASNFAADYRTGTGEQRDFAMDGGLHVQMNTQTRLNVEHGSQKIAAVRLLNGEADFDASQLATQKIAIVAESGLVSASHARFQVRYLDDEVCVTCTSGEVNVKRGPQETRLVAGQQMTYNATYFGFPKPVDTGVVTAWRKRMLIFNKTTLANVVHEVNRYRPGKLLLRGDQLSQQMVQASFSLDRLDDVIALVQDVYGAKVTQLPGGIVVLRQA